MAARRIQIVLISFIIKNAILDTGVVNDMYKNKTFYCKGASKYAFIVNSQIQCIHRCLRKSCILLNYRTTESETENCEVFTGGSQCSTLVYKENWTAMRFMISNNEIATQIGLEYIGCYKDTNNRALPSQQILNTALGKLREQCIDKCRSLKHPYAGLQYHQQCFCGTTFDKHGKVAESQCNHFCVGSSTVICGGFYMLSVYKTCEWI